MKRALILSILMIAFSAAFSQWNYPEKGHVGCNHAKGQNLKGAEAVFYFQSDYLWDYDVKFYFVDIEVSPTSIDVGGNVTIHADVVSAILDTLALEFTDGMIVDSAFVNGVIVTPNHTDNHIFMQVPTTLNQGESFVLQVYYHGTPTGGFLAGVSTAYNSIWDQNVTWSLSEPYVARDWFPVKQVLPDKADSCWVFLTTDDQYMAGSQGLLTAVTPMPDSKLRYEWKSKYPINYYLISFAVSDYQEYNIYAKPTELNGDSILIQNFLYDHPNIINTYKDDIDQTIDFMELFSDLYILYPFHEEKYGHCLAENGGMEHQTMTTIGGFAYDLVSHEIAHMWWGDNVTCATWSDIWINEGFASYGEYHAREHLEGISSANSWINSKHNTVMALPDGSVYVPPDQLDDIWRILDSRLSYDKGAAIIHMIRFELQDDDLFLDIMKEFQTRFTDSTATGLDFKAVVEEISGIDFSNFFDQWYFGEGYPTYSIVWNQTEEGLNMNVTQTASASSVTPVFKMLMEYRVSTTEVDTLIRLYQTNNFNQFTIPLPGEVGTIIVDPNNWVLNKTGSIIVGIEETRNPVYFTYGPNPARDYLILYMANSDGADMSVSIHDMTGRNIINQQRSGETIKVDISSLPKGSYLIKVQEGKYKLTKRFVKI